MRVDGKPYFSIYAISSLLNVFKSVEEINRLLKEFREDARKVVGEIHINAVIGELSLLPGEDIEMGFPLLNQLDVDSYSSYCWLVALMIIRWHSKPLLVYKMNSNS
jgi:hypothetical protein